MTLNKGRRLLTHLLWIMSELVRFLIILAVLPSCKQWLFCWIGSIEINQLLPAKKAESKLKLLLLCYHGISRPCNLHQNSARHVYEKVFLCSSVAQVGVVFQPAISDQLFWELLFIMEASRHCNSLQFSISVLQSSSPKKVHVKKYVLCSLNFVFYIYFKSTRNRVLLNSLVFKAFCLDIV